VDLLVVLENNILFLELLHTMRVAVVALIGRAVLRVDTQVDLAEAGVATTLGMHPTKMQQQILAVAVVPTALVVLVL
jgi:hypothetical protein